MTQYARSAEYVKASNAVRYLCPIDACDFVHDDPTCGPVRLLVDVDPATGELDIAAAINRNITERDLKIAQVMRGHLETHTVNEWVQQTHDMRVRQRELEERLRRAEQAIDAAKEQQTPSTGPQYRRGIEW